MAMRTFRQIKQFSLRSRASIFGLVAFNLVILSTANAATDKASLPWQKKMNDIVHSSHVPEKRLGLIIARDDGTSVAELNADQPMTPASLTKVATAAAVLQKFPVGYQFLTELLSDKAPAGSTLDGSLYLRGSGDAGFVSESMWFLVNEFTRTGVREIKGDLIIDDTAFDSVRRDPTRDQATVDRAYDSPVGAMTMNWSAVSVFVRPATKSGEAAIAYADPENEYIKLVNKAKTVSSGATKIEITNESIGKTSSVDEETVVVKGTIAVGAPEFVAYKAITKPEIWAGYNLRSFLKQRGITVTGKVRSGAAPSSAKVLATNKSKPVGDLVSTMMKWSNNYVAEILTKGLGLYAAGKPGTMEKGTQIVREFLKQIGVKDVEFDNPSGLSRKNSFRPKDLAHVLQYVQKHFEIFPEYLASLPIGGVDGTLRKRNHQTDVVGTVRAKTGHLAGVAGLAGYVGSHTGQSYSFVFLYNGSAEESYKAQEVFDKLVFEIQKFDDGVKSDAN